MSLLTSASFILTPNAYKANKLYSIVPSSGNGDLTFTRATSASRVNSSGLIQTVLTGVPRLDYSGSTPAWLFEPQRTNLFTYSNDFGDSSWNKVNLTVSNSTVQSPFASGSATLLTATSETSNIGKIITVPTSSYTTSYYLKYINQQYITIVHEGTPLAHTTFDLINGTKSSVGGTAGFGVSASIEPVNDGWYRTSLTINVTQSNFPLLPVLWIGQYNQTNNAGSQVYVGGAQLESGSYATSYIPTTTSTVTRNEDECYKTGISSLLNPSEGTFYVEIAALANDLTSRLISLSDNTDFNQVQIQFNSLSGNNIIRLDTFGGATATAPTTGSNYRSVVTVSDQTTFHKCLIKWGAGGLFGYVDGVKSTLTLANQIPGTGIPAALNRITFRQWWGGNIFYGKCKGMQIYKTALTDAECASLTTL